MAAAPTGSYADYVARREERLAKKSTRYGEWAEKRIEKREETEARYHQIADQIPFGQPILVGHHSEGRARKDIARMHTLAGKEIEHIEKAEHFAYKSKACAAALEEQTDPSFCARRIEEAEVGIRKAEKEIGLIPIYQKVGRAVGGDMDHWTGWLAHYQEQKAFWVARLESVGGLPVSLDQIKKGYWVRNRRWNQWREVARVNKKSVSILEPVPYPVDREFWITPMPISDIAEVREVKPE